MLNVLEVVVKVVNLPTCYCYSLDWDGGLGWNGISGKVDEMMNKTSNELIGGKKKKKNEELKQKKRKTNPFIEERYLAESCGSKIRYFFVPEIVTIW